MRYASFDQKLKEEEATKALQTTSVRMRIVSWSCDVVGDFFFFGFFSSVLCLAGNRHQESFVTNMRVPL